MKYIAKFAVGSKVKLDVAALDFEVMETWWDGRTWRHLIRAGHVSIDNIAEGELQASR